MLHRGDDRAALAQPPAVEGAGQAVLPQRVVAEQAFEKEIHLVGERLGVDVEPAQVALDRAVVGPRMHRFLADETLHVVAQAGVANQRQGLVVEAAEPQFAGRQEHVQDVHHLGRFRFAGNPVQGVSLKSKRTLRWTSLWWNSLMAGSQEVRSKRARNRVAQGAKRHCRAPRCTSLPTETTALLRSTARTSFSPTVSGLSRRRL